jgi:hypothetical protein
MATDGRFFSRLVRQSGAESKQTLEVMQIKSSISVAPVLPSVRQAGSSGIGDAVFSTGK